MWTRLRSKLRYLARQREIDRDLAEEIESHRLMLADDAEAEGATRSQALQTAARRMGNTTVAAEDARDAWSMRWLDALARDLRYGVRSLVRNPGFTAVAFLTLALGVGANVAIFSIVDAVLLRPLPFRDPDRLMRVTFDNPGVGLRDIPFSIPEFDDLRKRADVFEDVTATMSASANLTGATPPERLELLGASPSYFSLLGVAPQIGRLFDERDAADGFSTTVVISDALWRRAYGADPGVLGRRLRLDNDLYTIVGVLSPGFRHPAPTIARDVDVWAATGFRADPFPRPLRSARILRVAIGRLRSDVTVGEAQARLGTLAAELRREFAGDYPAEADWTIHLQPLQQALVVSARPMLLLFLASVGLVILVVSLNLGSLLLARASKRQQEMAMRVALGASRMSLARQMITESIVLSLTGGAAGVAAAAAVMRSMLRFVPANIPRLAEVRIDWAVLGFALLLSLGVGAVFGLAPAIRFTRSSLVGAARGGWRRAGFGVTTRLRDALVVAEVATAVVLVIGSGLLMRTLVDLLETDPGFNPNQVVAAAVWLPVPNDPSLDPYLTLPQQNAFSHELLRRMSLIPGVARAAITSSLPTRGRNNTTALVIEDRPTESLANLSGEVIAVSPDYFRVMETPLVRGRFFAESDESGRQPVAIIDEATVRRYWVDRDPIGRRLRFGQNPSRPLVTVVGIVRDVKHDGLDVDDVPHVYVPLDQNLSRTPNVVLRTALATSALEPRIQREIHAIDPGLPVFDVASMDDVLDASLASRRFSATLVAGFAALALLLASIGIYGLLACIVGERAHEIGVRAALGASRRDIVSLVIRKGVLLAGGGVVLGVVVSVWASSAIASLLYGVRPHDPTAFVAAPVLLFVVAVLSSYLPARRGAQIDPLIVLRET